MLKSCTRQTFLRHTGTKPTKKKIKINNQKRRRRRKWNMPLSSSWGWGWSGERYCFGQERGVLNRSLILGTYLWSSSPHPLSSRSAEPVTVIFLALFPPSPEKSVPTREVLQSQAPSNERKTTTTTLLFLTEVKVKGRGSGENSWLRSKEFSSSHPCKMERREEDDNDEVVDFDQKKKRRAQKGALKKTGA